MAVILSNRQIYDDIFLIKLNLSEGNPGQFYMLRVGSLLNRPISIYDIEEDGISFLYRVIGEGTKALSLMHEGDTLLCYGPYGNGFPLFDSDLTAIGGGMGIAPLHGLLKAHQKQYPSRERNVYLGFSKEAFLLEEFSSLATSLTSDIGGYITEKAAFQPDHIAYTCGPEPMMRAAAKKAGEEITLYVSMENRMACGIGACLGCNISTKSGNRRVCKDGPVFFASEVFYE